MSRRGRKTKLTPELLSKLENALAQGNYVETACAYVGISRAVYYHWVNEAQKPNAKKIYLDFLDTVERAKAVAEMRNLQIIQAAAMGKPDDKENPKDPDWKAAAWFLERGRQKSWGRHERVELSGTEGGPINVSVDTKQALLEIIREKQPKVE
jgi:transposase